MSWGTQGNAYYQNDMDSKNPAEGVSEAHRLYVRDWLFQDPDPNDLWRVEIADTDQSETHPRQALKVTGGTRLVSETAQGYCPDALEVVGRVSIDRLADGEVALLAKGTTVCRMTNDGESQPSLVVSDRDDYALGELNAVMYLESTRPLGPVVPVAAKIKGLTWLMRDINDVRPDARVALNVDGQTHLNALYDAQHHLFVDNNPLVVTGMTSLQALPDQEGQPPEEALVVTGRSEFTHPVGDTTALTVQGDVIVSDGTVQATALDINGNGNVSGVLEVRGALIGDENIAAVGQLSGASLDINGDGDVSGNLAVHGNLSGEAGEVHVSGNANVSGGLTTTNNVNSGGVLIGGGLDINGGGDVLNHLAVHGGLTVEAGANITGDAYVDGLVRGDSVLSRGAVTASSLDINGNGDVSGSLDVHGKMTVYGGTAHGDTVNMQGQHLLMGGTGAGEVKMNCATNRLEIYVGGTLRFYIDSTGGHNA